MVFIWKKAYKILIIKKIKHGNFKKNRLRL